MNWEKLKMGGVILCLFLQVQMYSQIPEDVIVVDRIYEWIAPGQWRDVGQATYASDYLHCGDDPTEVIEVTSATGRVWMDRNLGASRVANAFNDSEAYGDLFQWGRYADLHQCRGSATTNTLSNTDRPNIPEFITVGGNPRDWRSPQNGNLWQSLYGDNNPCPFGYRLPTEAEWELERGSWNQNGRVGAFNSPLKLSTGGSRANNNGNLSADGSDGYYWSSTTLNTDARRMTFGSGNSAAMATGFRSLGSSVRCIKD
jgi:uncharacterized protein (TIGR02145 family)